jgi:hypothetical protein
MSGRSFAEYKITLKMSYFCDRQLLVSCFKYPEALKLALINLWTGAGHSYGLVFQDALVASTSAHSQFKFTGSTTIIQFRNYTLFKING